MKYKTSFLFIIFSIILFSFILYVSEIRWDSTRRTYYLQYIIFSFIVLIASILTLYFKEKINQNILLVVISSVITLYSVELVLYFTNYQLTNDTLKKNIKYYQEQTGLIYDTRTKYMVFKELKKKNTIVAPSIAPKNLFGNKDAEFLPLTSKSNSLTVYCNENGYWSIYLSDTYGFNNPNQDWKEKNIDFLILGDSFGKGACVNRPNDIASLLRAKNLTGLSLSHGGYGPLIQLAVLKEYSEKFDTIKNVIFFYYEGNDLANLNYSSQYKLLNRYLDDKNFSQKLLYKQDLVDSLASQEIERNKKKKLFEILKLTNVRGILNFKKIDYDEFKPKFITEKCINSLVCIQTGKIDSNFKKIILRAKEISKEKKANFYLVYLPEYWRYDLSSYPDQTRNEIISFLKKQQINYIDLHEKLFSKMKNPKDLYAFRINNHYNLEGYKNVANEIFNNIFEYYN